MNLLNHNYPLEIAELIIAAHDARKAGLQGEQQTQIEKIFAAVIELAQTYEKPTNTNQQALRFDTSSENYNEFDHAAAFEP